MCNKNVSNAGSSGGVLSDDDIDVDGLMPSLVTASGDAVGSVIVGGSESSGVIDGSHRPVGCSHHASDGARSQLSPMCWMLDMDCPML